MFIINCSSIILTAAHCICWFGDAKPNGKKIPCRPNRDNPTSLEDHVDQQYAVNNREVKIFYIVGKKEIDDGSYDAHLVHVRLHEVFESKNNARVALKAMVMSTIMKDGRVVKGDGYDIGLIQMQMWDCWSNWKAGSESIEIPDGPIPQ